VPTVFYGDHSTKPDEMTRIENEIANSLYKAASIAIGGGIKSASVRKGVVNLLRQNPAYANRLNKSDFPPFNTDEQWQHYCDQKLDLKLIGAEIDIVALVDLYNRPIHLYEEGLQPTNTTSQQANNLQRHKNIPYS